VKIAFPAAGLRPSPLRRRPFTTVGYIAAFSLTTLTAGVLGFVGHEAGKASEADSMA
jgi:hypothetical protein